MVNNKTLKIAVATLAATLCAGFLILNLGLGEKKISKQIESLYSVDDPQFLRGADLPVRVVQVLPPKTGVAQDHLLRDSALEAEFSQQRRARRRTWQIPVHHDDVLPDLSPSILIWVRRCVSAAMKNCP